MHSYAVRYGVNLCGGAAKLLTSTQPHGCISRAIGAAGILTKLFDAFHAPEGGISHTRRVYFTRHMCRYFTQSADCISPRRFAAYTDNLKE